MKSGTIYNGLLLILIIQFLLINWYTKSIGNELMQIAEWHSLCVRGVALVIGCALVYVMSKVTKTTFMLQPSKLIAIAIIISAIAEAIYGLRQYYGNAMSNNGLFCITGSFYNPGPFGGYLSVGFVVAMNELFEWRNRNKWIKYGIEFTLLLLLYTLILSMSRTAWIAALLGTLFVGSQYYDWKSIIKRNKLLSVISAIIGAISLYAIIKVKLTSALGRLFMWKISCKAMLSNPLFCNYGFAYVYGNEQELYFSSNNYSAWEANVAGSVDNAFNEYLNFGVQYGIGALLLILLLICLIIRLGCKKKLYGLIGGQIALCVFSFASYPMHIPEFIALEIVILFGVMICNCKKVMHICLGGVLAFCTLVYGVIFCNDTITRINDIKLASTKYKYTLFSEAASLYSKVENRIPPIAEYWFEYGHALHKSGYWEESTRVLKEAEKLTMDPMILNIIGKNMQEIGNYEESERYFKKAINRLPNRMYPHYLLFHLYSSEGYKNETLRMKEAEIILTQQFKVESSATKEMKEEVKTLMKEDL